MRTRYWDMYVEARETYFYYWHYRIRSKHLDNGISAFLLIASSAAVASWFVWEQYRLIWGIITCAAQILSAVKSLMPFASRVKSVDLLLPDMDDLLTDIDETWCGIDLAKSISDTDEINRLTHEYEVRLHKLENRFTGGTYWPRNNYCLKKATEDRQKFFYSQYGIGSKEDLAEEACDCETPDCKEA